MMDIILLVKIAFGVFVGFVCFISLDKLSIKRSEIRIMLYHLALILK